MKNKLKIIWEIIIIMLASTGSCSAKTVNANNTSGVMPKYFTEAVHNTNTYAIIIIVISLLFVLCMWYIWATEYKRNDEINKTVEFYPPNGYSPEDVGFLYKGFANKNSVSSSPRNITATTMLIVIFYSNITISIFIFIYH